MLFRSKSLAIWSKRAVRSRLRSHGLGMTRVCSRGGNGAGEGKGAGQRRRGGSWWPPYPLAGLRRGELVAPGRRNAQRPRWSLQEEDDRKVLQGAPWLFYFSFVRVLFSILFSVLYFKVVVKQLFEVSNNFRKM